MSTGLQELIAKVDSTYETLEELDMREEHLASQFIFHRMFNRDKRFRDFLHDCIKAFGQGVIRDDEKLRKLEIAAAALAGIYELENILEAQKDENNRK